MVVTKDAGAKPEVMNKAANALGTVAEKKGNPVREAIASVSCGDLQVRFESVEWLIDKEDPAKGYDLPQPNFVAYVDGYKNANGYRKEISLSGEVEDLRNIAKLFSEMADFVEKTGIDVSKSEYFKIDMGKAYEKFAPNGKAVLKK